MTAILLGVLLAYLLVGVYHGWLKPLPPDVSLEGQPCRVDAADIEFLHDVTGWQGDRQVSRQMLFDRVMVMIRDARDFVLVDFFLFNDFLGKDLTAHRPLCRLLTDELIALKQRHPEIRILVISDPVNLAYGNVIPTHFADLRSVGIPVVMTDLAALRDPNPLYSGLWRLCGRWLGTSTHRYLPHPLSPSAPGVGIRAWLSLLNFKANHRKLVIADGPTAAGRRMAAMVLSGNPHDASSAHGNVGLLVRGDSWRDLIRSEQAILNLSGAAIDLADWLPAWAAGQPTRDAHVPDHTSATVQVLTEGKIQKALLRVIATVKAGEHIDVALFYLSARPVIQALLNAAQRGAAVRILLDPNREAFGYPKNGIPNRPVAAELMKHGGGNLTVRWANTHREQFHTKMVLVRQADRATLILGSANLTRRNLGDFNLETDLMVSGPGELPALRDAADYFERLWTNQPLLCSQAYESGPQSSIWAYGLYRFQEATGLATF
jgi:phosphatidylserine/phosphatidylglycerophosphate/cardiolipin synthase-like enzyme